MKETWEAPGKISEPAGKQLGSFGITSLPGARINTVDPAVSQAQQQAMGAEMRRRRQGKKPRMPGMTDAQVHDYAATPRRGLPKRKGNR